MKKSLASVGVFVFSLWLMSAAAGAETNCDGRKHQLLDLQGYFAGSYISFLAPWNREGHVQGVDYVECIGYNEGSFPNQQIIAWNWPLKPPRSGGVYSFLAVDFGNYDHSEVREPIPSKAIKDIQVLEQRFALSFQGDRQGYNVIQNLFLTSEPGDQDKKLFELEVFLRTPNSSAAYVKSGAPIGVFEIAGRHWYATIDRHPKKCPDILVMPEDQADITSSSTDLKLIFDRLTQLGILTGQEYFNGMALGVEVVYGSGAVIVDRISTTYR